VRVLGIDPGTIKCGWGVVEEREKSFELVSFGTIKAPPRISLPERLKIVYEKLKNIIKKYRPDEIALEDTFLSNNVKAALSLGQARGVVLLLGSLNKVPVNFYTALQIKKAITGYGRATKQQLNKMLSHYFPEIDLDSFDTSDAISTALCHLNSKRFKR